MVNTCTSFHPAPVLGQIAGGTPALPIHRAEAISAMGSLAIPRAMELFKEVQEKAVRNSQEI